MSGRPLRVVSYNVHGLRDDRAALVEVIRDLDPTQIRGTIVACLQSSPAAFQERSAFVNPLDGQNLNRSFPGHPGGGPTARLAAWLWENLLARADYYIDCHCGDLPETLDPFTSVISSPNYMFLALDVEEGEATPEDGEILEAVKLPFDRVIEMVMSGEITHAASCVLVLKAARYLEQHG